MKKILLIFVFLRAISDVYSQTPTITTLSPIQSSYCAGGNFIVTYETTGTFSFGCVFKAELSDMWGNFSNPVTIGTVPFNTGIIPGTIPSSTSFGFNYRVRVVSDNPVVVGSVSPLPPIVITNAAVSAIVFTNPNDTVCFGDTVRLTSNLNESYVWSTGETTQSIYITESGSYNVTVTNYLTGCEVTSDDKIIVVNPLPDLNLGADTGICIGDELVLDAGEGYQIYKWNDVLSLSHDYTVHHAGTYFVEVLDTNNCINSDTINVVVNSNPVINLGNDTAFCGNVFFLDAGSGYASYNWNNGLSDDQVLQINQAGFYNVEITDSNHCKDYDTIEVNIMPTPYLYLGNDIKVCGSSITLDAGDGFTMYNWNDGAADTQYFTITQSGSYNVLVADSNNCRVSDTININLNSSPQVFIGYDFTVSNNHIIVLDAGSGFAQYLWSDGSTGQSLFFNSSDLGEGIFLFWVNVIDSNNCFNSDTIVITISFSNNISENDKFVSNSVFPNPFNDKANITFQNFIGNLNLLRFNVYDILGRECYFDHSILQNSISVNAINQKKGIYSYVISNDNVILQKGRFVVN